MTHNVLPTIHLKRAVVVLSEANENVYRSFKNFPKVEVRLGSDLCAYDVVNGGLVIAESGVIEQVAARVAGKMNDGGEG